MLRSAAAARGSADSIYYILVLIL